MRDVLLANATATSILALRANILASQGVRCLTPSDRVVDNRHGSRDQEPSQASLTHLRYPAQPRLAPGRVLPRHEAEPSREIAPTRTLSIGGAKAWMARAVIGPVPGIIRTSQRDLPRAVGQTQGPSAWRAQLGGAGRKPMARWRPSRASRTACLPTSVPIQSIGQLQTMLVCWLLFQADTRHLACTLCSLDIQAQPRQP